MRWLFVLVLTACSSTHPKWEDAEKFCEEKTHFLERYYDLSKVDWKQKGAHAEFNYALGNFDGCLFGIMDWHKEKVE